MEWVVRSWARGDKSRLYLDRGGEKMGHLDTLTGEVVSPLARDEFLNRVASCLGMDSGASVTKTVVQPIVQAPTVLPIGVETLDSRQPGESLFGLLEQESYRLGVAGEQRTAGVLASLPDWKVLHSIPLSSKKDLDHLLIGPGGVLALDTKATRYEVRVDDQGVVRVNGSPKTWLEDIRATELIVRRTLIERLGIDGLPLAAWVVAWGETGVQPRGALLDGWSLRGRVAALPDMLTAHDQNVIYEAARLRNTWA